MLEGLADLLGPSFEASEIVQGRGGLAAATGDPRAVQGFLVEAARFDLVAVEVGQPVEGIGGGAGPAGGGPSVGAGDAAAFPE